MHTVFALLCFVMVIHWLIFPYPSGLLHWHCGNLTIAPVPAKQPWWIWINTSCESIMNDCINTTKQSTTKPCAYFLGYTVAIQIRWESLIVAIRLLTFGSSQIYLHAPTCVNFVTGTIHMFNGKISWYATYVCQYDALLHMITCRLIWKTLGAYYTFMSKPNRYRN